MSRSRARPASAPTATDAASRPASGPLGGGVPEPAVRAIPAVAAATAICPADARRVLGDEGGGEAPGGDGAVTRDDASADGAAETGARQTPAGDVGAIGLPTEGTYRNPSASPSRRTRLEIPTLESRHDPPPLDTKTAQ
jgi:hypothetical protein